MNARLKFLPNVVTILRIVLTPVALGLLVSKKFTPAFALYVILACTDCLDGYLARKLNAQSKLGTFLDPIADKFISILLYTGLMILGNCPPWFLGLVIAVTVLQALGLSWIEAVSKRKKVTFAPLFIGKVNMLLQLTWIGWMVLRLALNSGQTAGYISWPESVFYVVLAVLQVGVFMTYFFHYRVHLSPEIKTFFPVHPHESTV